MYHMTDSTAEWLQSSLMATRGVGRDRTLTMHELTEEKQGRFHYTMGPYSEPVLQYQAGRPGRGADAGRLRGQDHQGDRPTLAASGCAVPKSAERPYHGRGSAKGRRPRSLHRIDGAARREPTRKSLAPSPGPTIRRRSMIRCPRSSARSISTSNGSTGARGSHCRTGLILAR